MREYEKLVSKIEEYKKKEDIVESDEVISALDLCNIVNDRFAKLRSIENGEVLRRKINKDNNDLVKFSRKIRKVHTLLNYECDRVVPIVGNNGLQITFYFANSTFEISIGKNIGENEIYYILKNEKDDLLVNRYYDDIMNIFNILEEYYELFLISQCGLKYRDELKASYDIFDLEIAYYIDGDVYCQISLNKDVDKDRISEREYINKPSIRNILGQKSKQLLNKIPIQKSSLPPMLKKILEEREKTSVKKLIRR